MENLMKIGFCCKFVSDDKEKQERLNTKTTTITWLNRNTKTDAEEKLEGLVAWNLKATKLLLEEVSSYPDLRKMLRLTSDILPAYTHKDWNYFYQSQDARALLEKEFAEIGEFARTNNIKLSFHPGQYVCLASDRPEVVANSIKEFEYHADMIRFMGYGREFQDFKCNVHASGKYGIKGIRDSYKKLSTEARNTITIENDEMVYGLDEVLELTDILPIVLDIHHNWCKTNEYIASDDDRVKKVIDSWRGKRPTLHYSYSRNEYLKDHTSFPCLNERALAKVSKSKLRAHSDMYPNELVNAWALSFLENFDIACEAKMKNLAAEALAKQFERQYTSQN